MKKLLIIVCFVSCSFLGFSQQPDSTWIIKNLDINSVAAEYTPFWLDSILCFTSTRRNNREDKLLEYTEKVYYTQMADTSFGKVKKLSYGSANIDANSALVGMSNKYWFLYRGYFNDQGKLFMAPRKQEINIESLQEVPYINSDDDENSVAANGDSLIFTSNRTGNYEIYIQTGNGKSIPLDTLNSPFDENGVWISPSGKEMYFNSNREGWFYVYRSDLVDGKWQSPKKLPAFINYPGYDNIDYRQHHLTGFFASNRPGGKGDYDIYQLTQPKEIIPPPDTIKIVVDSIPKQDTLKRQIVPKTLLDSITAEEQTLIELERLGLIPFRGRIQFAAFRKDTTMSIEKFKRLFKCISNENLRMDIVKDVENLPPMRKLVLDHIYYDLDSALNKQKEIINRNCFPKDFKDTPFIALLRADGMRFAIFWEKEQYLKKEVLWIYGTKLDNNGNIIEETKWHSK